MTRLFGPVPGVDEGQSFRDRRAASNAGVHRPTMAGISGTAVEGADSIVLNGGYEDDEDYGTVVVYTGHGGNDPQTKKQIADQEFAQGNAGLAVSASPRAAVRVVRGPKGDPVHSPSTGYRYDGIYRVDDWWSETGISGFKIFRYRLVKEPGGGPDNPPPGSAPGKDEGSRYSTVQRLVRNTAVTQWVKERHRFTCQVCGIRLMTPSGPYAEGAHIRPRGKSRNGPDISGNVLCLCPNDHVLLDRGFLTISDNLEVVESGSDRVLGRLRLKPEHDVDRVLLAYHRAHFAHE